MSKARRIGYLRVSSADQSTARQLDGVQVDRVYEDAASGKDTNRPELARCLDALREDDTLVVHSMDRLARSLRDLEQLVADLTKRGVAVQFVKEGLTFTGDDNPMATLMLQLMGAVGQFERALIKERQREGIAVAKTKGVYKGRKPSLSAAQVAEIRAAVAADPKVNKAALAKRYGVSRATLYAVLEAA